MSKHLIINPDEVLNFGKVFCESRLLLDSKMAGEPCINVNHCTIPRGGCSGLLDKTTGKRVGAAHEKPEIYVCISGHGDLWLDNFAPHGDACVTAEGTSVSTGPVIFRQTASVSMAGMPCSANTALT